MLRESVQNWMGELLQQPRCSPFTEHFLDLVTRMLEVDRDKRLTAGQVNSELSQMIGAGKHDASYFQERSTRSLRAQKIKHVSLESQDLINSTYSLNPNVGQPLPTS